MCHSQVNNKEMIMKYRNLIEISIDDDGIVSQSLVGVITDVDSQPLEGAIL